MHPSQLPAIIATATYFWIVACYYKPHEVDRSIISRDVPYRDLPQKSNSKFCLLIVLNLALSQNSLYRNVFLANHLNNNENVRTFAGSFATNF